MKRQEIEEIQRYEKRPNENLQQKYNTNYIKYYIL